MDELSHECGVAAVYHLPGPDVSPLAPLGSPDQVSRLMPRMLLDLQNRGQLSAGFSSYNPKREQLLDTYKEIGRNELPIRMQASPAVVDGAMFLRSENSLIRIGK